MAQTNYNTNDLFLKTERVQNGAPIAAGTYKAGEVVGKVTATGLYKTYNSAGADGTQIPAGVVLNDVVVDGSTITSTAIGWGIFNKDGVTRVMASLSSAVTVNDAFVSACNDAGIVLD